MWLALSIILAITSAITLVMFGVHSPFQWSKRARDGFGYAYPLIAFLFAIRVVPDDQLIIPILLWFAFVLATHLGLKFFWPRTTNGQMELPF